MLVYKKYHCYFVTGQKGKGITFIFTDNEVKDEGFLEYLNNILSSGEISNLFARDELDEITGELVSVMKKQFPRRPPTQENLYNYFISRARKNLHVALCFSPVSAPCNYCNISGAVQFSYIDELLDLSHVNKYAVNVEAKGILSLPLPCSKYVLCSGGRLYHTRFHIYI